jgi:hypothetical protein
LVRTALDGRGLAAEAFALAEAEDSVTGVTVRFSVGFGLACGFARALGCRFAGFAAARLAGFARVALRVRVGPGAVPRAAARRALERCGRVRGRLPSTPPSFWAVFVAVPLPSTSGMCTSLLKAVAETLPGACKASGKPLRSTPVTR